MNFLNLPTLAELSTQRRAVPKGGTSSRLADKTAAKQDDKKQAAAFRAAVLTRDGMQCRLCGKPVRKTLELAPDASHVHHLRGRNVAPEDRYNPKKALTLCGACHSQVHQGTLKVTVKP